MKTYMLSAYKPQSADYCKGHCVATYPSDEIVEHNLTEEALIERIAQLKATPLDYNEEGYTCTFMEEPPPLPQEEIDRIEQLSDERAKVLAEEHKAAEQAKAEAKKAADQAAAEARERAEFERLKGKFGEKTT